MRLDSALRELHIFSSRNKAKEAILRGEVLYNDALLDKPSIEVTKDKGIFFLHNEIFDMRFLCVEPHFVSRAGYKLAGFLLDYKNGVLQDLEKFIKDFLKPQAKDTLCSPTDIIKSLQSLQIDELVGANALDVGVGTGGFSEVLLQCGANHIVCVDVGDKLSKKLRIDSRISFFGNCDVRDFAENCVDTSLFATFDIVVCDVSFISLKLIVDSLLHFKAEKLILLFKPQFEVGRNVKRNKKGVLNDKNQIVESLRVFSEILSVTHHLAFAKSRILGKEGNVEIFILATRKH